MDASILTYARKKMRFPSGDGEELVALSQKISLLSGVVQILIHPRSSQCLTDVRLFIRTKSQHMALMTLLMAVFMLQVEALVIRYPLRGALTVYQSPASDSITDVAVSKVDDFSSLEVPMIRSFCAMKIWDLFCLF